MPFKARSGSGNHRIVRLIRDVLILDENGLTYCHSFFSPFYFYQHQTSSQNSVGITPAGR